jgi:hypothetical protein
MDWSHQEEMMEKYQTPPYNGTLREAEDQKNSWRRQVSRKKLE